MKYLVFVLFFVASTAYSQEIRSVRNVWGGYNYFNNGKLEVSSRPNVYGGYNYQGKVVGSSRPSLHGGYNYQFRNPQQNVNRYVPMFNKDKK
jgi:hypothetical protein